MDIKEDMAKDLKSKKPKWDGTSRISNDLYRERWNEIFGKKAKPQKEWWKYMDCAPPKLKKENDAND